MKKRFAFLLLILTLALNPVFGALQDSISKRTEEFEHFYQENYQELVYVHTDKPYYLTGERIKFKVYCVEELTNTPSKLSKVAYVEVLDKENDPILQAKIDLKEGSGYGELFIPTNVNSGNFILRGYTRWMRNYGPESFFHTMLTIINPFKKLGLPPASESKEISIKFYPEGGKIINGLETKVVFDCKDGNGYPVNISGRLYANDTILVAAFEPAINGMGNFTFTPDILNRYHVELLHQDSTRSIHELPATTGKGLVIHVREEDDGYIADFFCNDQSIASAKEVLSTIVSQKGNILRTENFILQKGKKSMVIDPAIMEEGIFTISLFNSNGELLGLRKMFNYDKNHRNNTSVIEKSLFGQRDRVSVDFAELITDLPADDPDVSISISAYQDQFDHQTLNFEDYLLLNNSVLGIVPCIGDFFNKTPKEVSKAINNLLVAQGMNKNIWHRMNEIRGIQYIPEYRTPLITGSLQDKTTKSPGAVILTYLTIPGRNGRFFITRSNNDGSLLFEVEDFYNSNEIIVQNDYPKDTIYSIEIDNPFSEEYLDVDLPALNIDESLENWIKEQSQNMQVENSYLQYQPKLPLVTQVDSFYFYFEPDSRYYTDDYTRFIVMEEVMREYIAGVNVRKNRDGFHYMVVDIERNILYEKNPLIILDGLPVFDVDELMSFDPLKVEKIETVRQRFHRGALDCRGIVNYTTYKRDMGGFELSDFANVINYSGLQPRKQYYFPSYASLFDKRSKIPDYRNTLYWEPAIRIDEKSKEINIYTSDYASEYKIRIEGIDKKGNIYSYQGFMKVEESPDN